MTGQADILYYYDGSFDGLLCCVFESYDKKEIPMDILVSGTAEPNLFAGKFVPADMAKAGRVLASIPAKLGEPALHFVQRSFLTCLDQKELYILHFLRLGYSRGPAVMNMLTHEVVYKLFKAVKHLEKESHLLTGFIRFSVYNNVLVSEIEPKNFVLPLLSQHFCERYPEERFLIHDKTHGMGLVYEPYSSAIVPLDILETPEADEEEQKFRDLWRLFYDTIAIQDRYNPECRRSHMPKRYWQHMTELSSSPKKNHKLPGYGNKLPELSIRGLT